MEHGPHGMIFWLLLSHNGKLQSKSMFMILTQLSHLECAEFVGLYKALLISIIYY